jgi:hypothetical protein
MAPRRQQRRLRALTGVAFSLAIFSLLAVLHPGAPSLPGSLSAPLTIETVEGLRVRWFVRDLLAGRERGIYLAIELDPRDYKLPDGTPVDPKLYDGALPSPLVAPLARLRTDLDRFLPEEANLLSYHAYWSTHARLGALHPKLAVATPVWREYAALTPQESGRLVGLLEGGARRLRRPRSGVGPS